MRKTNRRAFSVPLSDYLSACAYRRGFKHARTIADLSGYENIGPT
jgi:hypothetical protein